MRARGRQLLLAACLLVLAGNVTAAPPGQDTRVWTFPQAGFQVIDDKCSVCHGWQRIEAAVQQRRDMLDIQRAMERKGAQLTEREREVLGIFWQRPPNAEQWQAPRSQK